jgi:hypothetical protein
MSKNIWTTTKNHPVVLSKSDAEEITIVVTNLGPGDIKLLTSLNLELEINAGSSGAIRSKALSLQLVRGEAAAGMWEVQ